MLIGFPMSRMTSMQAGNTLILRLTFNIKKKENLHAWSILMHDEGSLILLSS